MFLEFNTMTQHFNEEDLELICQTGVFPSEHIDNVEKFKETQLPPTKAFYSKLRGSGISNNEYKHVQYVYNTFDRQPFKTTTLYIQNQTFYCHQMFLNILETQS